MLSTFFEKMCSAGKKWEELVAELEDDDETIPRIGDQSNGNVYKCLYSIFNEWLCDAHQDYVTTKTQRGIFCALGPLKVNEGELAEKMKKQFG